MKTVHHVDVIVIKKELTNVDSQSALFFIITTVISNTAEDHYVIARWSGLFFIAKTKRKRSQSFYKPPKARDAPKTQTR